MQQVIIHVDRVCQLDPSFVSLSNLCSAFKVLDPNRYFEPAFKNGRWDGTYRFVSSDGRFRLGLLRSVCNWLRKQGYKPDLKLAQKFKLCSGYKPELLDMDKFLRKEQLASIDKMNRSLMGVIALPTSAGKTEIMLDYARCHPKLRILYVCTRKLLMQQTAQRASKYLGEDVNRLGGCVHDYDKANRFTVAVDKTFDNLLQRKVIPVDAFDVVLVDECHHAVAATLRRIIDKLAWKRLFGFTGSYPTEERNLIKHWMVKQIIGSPLVYVSDKEYSEKHSEHIPEIKIYRVMNQVQLGMVSGREIYDALKASKDRNELIALLAKKLGYNTLIVVNHTQHGDALLKYCKAAGVTSCDFIASDRGSQAQAIRALDSGDLQLLIATPIIDEGISVNNIRNIIYAAGWKSEIQLLQRIGRGKRKKDTGKNQLVMVDFADLGNRVCARNSRQRFNVYRDVTDIISDVKIGDLLKANVS